MENLIRHSKIYIEIKAKIYIEIKANYIEK